MDANRFDKVRGSVLSFTILMRRSRTLVFPVLAQSRAKPSGRAHSDNARSGCSGNGRYAISEAKDKKTQPFQKSWGLEEDREEIYELKF